MEATKKVLYPNLRAEIARHGDTLNDLANLLGVAVPSVSRRLSGEIVWNINEIDLLCKRYQVSYEILFKRE